MGPGVGTWKGIGKFPGKIPGLGGNVRWCMHVEPDNADEAFVGLITRHQAVVFRYILSMEPDPTRAEDILQETNLVLWRKAAEYDMSRPFIPWACRIALFQVKAHRRDRARDRHVFDDDVLDLIAADTDAGAEEPTHLEQSLRECLGRLPGEHRALILARYEPGASVETLATARKQTANALSQTLFRIRRTLADCLERKMQTSRS